MGGKRDRAIRSGVWRACCRICCCGSTSETCLILKRQDDRTVHIIFEDDANIPKDFLGKYRANIEEVTREANKLVLDLIWSKEDPNEIREDLLEKMTKEKSFPYVAKDIFGQVDHKSLLKAREVSHKWKEFIDQESMLWTKLYTSDNYTEAAYEFKAINTASPMSDSKREKNEKQRHLNELICSITRNMVQYSKHPNPTQRCIVTCNNNPEVYQGRFLTDMKYTCNTHDTNDIQYCPMDKRLGSLTDRRMRTQSGRMFGERLT